MRQPHTLILPDAVRVSLKQHLETIGSPYDEIERFLVSLYPIFAKLPFDVLQQLRAFTSDSQTPGFLVIDNCPMDNDIPHPPHDGYWTRTKSTFVSEGCLLGLSQLLGEPLGYHGEKGGEIIQNVCPVPSEAEKTSSESSGIPLGFHTDFDFDERAPEAPYNINNADFIVLLCLIGDPAREAYTLYADARDLCATLNPDELATLRAPLFQFQTSYSFARSLGVERRWCSPTPIIKGPANSPEISIDMLCGVRGITKEANSVLAKLPGLCTRNDVIQGICLQSGQALLINNRKGAHARTAFRSYSHGPNRWLQRVYVRHSLWELRSESEYSPRVF